MTKARDIADFKFENIVDTGTEGTKVASGTTAQRGSTAGQIRFNSTTTSAEFYNGSEFVTLNKAPVISSISPTTSFTANENITITGSNFLTGATVKFIGNDGTEYASPSVTRNSSTQLTAQTPSTVMPVSNEPYDIKVINADNQFGILSDGLDAGSTPVFVSPASGSLGSFYEDEPISQTFSVTDADAGQTVVYSSSGTIPTGLTLNTSTGVLSGTAGSVSSETTSSFNIIGTAGVDTVSRSFSMAIKDQSQASITDVNIQVHTSDNCNDSGTIGGQYDYDFGSQVYVDRGYIYNVYGGGQRDAGNIIYYSDDNSTWYPAIVGYMLAPVNACGIYRTTALTSSQISSDKYGLQTVISTNSTASNFAFNNWMTHGKHRYWRFNTSYGGGIRASRVGLAYTT